MTSYVPRRYLKKIFFLFIGKEVIVTHWFSRQPCEKSFIYIGEKTGL